jgi:hypothetical protein
MSGDQSNWRIGLDGVRTMVRRFMWMWPAMWTNRSNTSLHMSFHRVSLRALKTAMLHEAMMGPSVMLPEVVSSVELAGSPAVQVELSLCVTL